MQQTILSDLQQAALQENWDFIDTHISEIANDLEVLSWATNEGLNDVNGNLRDLAVSFLEKSRTELSPETSQQLFKMFDDENPYVGFRAAFALFSHGDKSQEVITKIREASTDPDVKEIAEGYLVQLS